MRASRIIQKSFPGLLLVSGLLCANTDGFAQSPGEIAPIPEAAAPTDASKILVEISLSTAHRDDLAAIKQEFQIVGVSKVRHTFFRSGNPPRNIAIGRNVPAPIGRLAIRLAQTYNGGINFLLPEERLASNYIAIGTSIFDELFQYPVTQEDIARLGDANLTTEQFHALYRQLANIEKKRYR